MQLLQSRFALISILMGALLAFPFATACAEQVEKLPAATDEMLLFQDIPSVFSASKYEQKVTEAPSAVSIVTAEEIERYGYRTLSDVLRRLRGFHLSSNRAVDLIGVRGFNRPGDSNSRILLLINGHRVNDNIFNAAATGTDFLLDIDLIDRVEVVRGPSSSLYGTNAFFAIINVITKRGRDLQGTEISGAAGNQQTYQGRLSFGDRSPGGIEGLISGTWYDSEGNDRLFFPEFDDPATNNGVANDLDDDAFQSLFGRFAFLDYTLEGAYIDRQKVVPTAPYGTLFNTPGTEGDAEQGYVSLSYRRHLAQQGELLARVSYNRYHADADYVYDYSPTSIPFLVVNKDEFRGEWWGGELQFTQNLGERHKVILGGEYHNNFRQDQKNYDLDVYLDTQDESDNWGLFLQDEFRLGNSLVLNAGVRHDHYDTFGGTTNPRLALIYNPVKKTTLKLLYGTAFRAPSAFEFYYHDGFATQRPNPNLEPEEIETWEVVWEQVLNSHWRSIVSAFHYEIDELIDLNFELIDPLGDPDDPANIRVFFDNLSRVKADGVDLSIEGHWESGLEGRISYSFQQAKVEGTGELLSNSPKHLAKLNIALPIYGDKLFLGIEEQFTGSRKTISGEKTGSYAITNLTLYQYNLLPRLDLSASIYNLLDKKFSDPVSGAFVQETIERDGRLFRFKAKWTF